MHEASLIKVWPHRTDESRDGCDHEVLDNGFAAKRGQGPDSRSAPAKRKESSYRGPQTWYGISWMWRLWLARAKP
eukprot:6014204-Amphidinium_carterae.1